MTVEGTKINGLIINVTFLLMLKLLVFWERTNFQTMNWFLIT